MEHMFQPNDWSCLPTAFGMCLALTPKEMIERIGHSGAEILWPDVPEPYCRRAFSVEECIAVCLDEVTYPVVIPVLSAHKPEGSEHKEHITDMSGLVRRMMETRDGVILGRRKGSDHPHAVAWCACEGKVYDPSGGCSIADEYDIDFFIGMF